MAQKRLNTLEDWESQVCSWRTNNDVNWKSGCARMENGNEGERERKKKKKGEEKNSCRRTRAAQRWKKESFLWRGETPSGFREKEIAPG